MSKPATKLLSLALAGAGTLGALYLFVDSGTDEAAGTKNLTNQIWLERLPENDRDMIAHLLVLDHPRAKIGVAGKSSQWRHFLEAFKWRLKGDELLTAFPQERARAKFQVKTWNCEGDAPHPFELCLKISRGDRSAVFYSREDWVVEPHDAAASIADLAAEYPELAGVSAEFSESQVTQIDAVDPDAMAELEGDRLF